MAPFSLLREKVSAKLTDEGSRSTVGLTRFRTKRGIENRLRKQVCQASARGF